MKGEAKRGLRAWPPALVLTAGAFLTLGAGGQRSLPLRVALADALPRAIGHAQGTDVTVSPEEQRVAGMTSYLMRTYAEPGRESAYSLYVGYYAEQTRQRTIHSPKNCLPGAGWQALAATRATVPVGGHQVSVNRYVLQRANERALVLYWYQGRGRIQADEYTVKWNLLRDVALRHRSDEALVRIVVPFSGDEAAAEQLARAVASRVIPALTAALPA
jgi:EpsI family protein